ncbi:hypothetical protein [Parasitella parasitica]|uniref:START domain-containing protein n=1 Tax=Parasitella parasitica TaxID=35722 RepID=A0A0B7NJ20_9FUNG|nr:hypothetical protein [Parasitella parasitica]
MKFDKVDQATLKLKDTIQQHLKHIKAFDWVDSVDEEEKKDSKVYAHVDDKTLVTTYKATADFTPKHFNSTILDYYRACLSTVELRGQCTYFRATAGCLLKRHDYGITSLRGSIVAADGVEHEAIWLEQTACSRQAVQFIAASSTLDFFFAVEIKDASATTTARATVYLQWPRPTLSTPSATLARLIQLKPYPWIKQCDETIDVKKLEYDTDEKCRIDYIYHNQQQALQAMSPLPHAAVDIRRQNINSPSRWHSGSWDQQQQTVRKNKFLTSSSLMFSSPSANSSPQLRPMAANSSYPDKQHSNSVMASWLAAEEDEEDRRASNSVSASNKFDKDELRIQVAYIPQITITLPERLASSDKFAQLCVRCYHRQHQRESYVIQILHPQKIMQYFTEVEEASMRLDDDDDDKGPLSVSVTISKSNSKKFMVNKNEWPIRSWTSCSSDDDDDEKDNEDKKEEDDIFVDGMEELAPESSTIAYIPTKSSASLIQTNTSDPVMSKEEAALPETHPLTKNAVDETQPADPNNIITIPEPDPPQEIDLDEYRLFENKIPPSDPAALQQISPQFNEYLQSSIAATFVQSPTRENGNVIIRKIDNIANHPLGGFLSESTWRDCSIWDIKAVLESTGARRIWDNTFENSTYLHALTPTSSLWHTKMKGAWPVSPRDYVCFHGQYTSPYRIDLLTTSCFGDSFQYKPLPAPVAGYTRATMDVMGWRLERIDDRTASVKQVLVTQFPTWVIHYITSRFIVQTCAAVQSAREYFETFGAPPSLEHLTCAQLVNVKHDHERKNWRCEYTRRLATAEKDAPAETATQNHINNTTVENSLTSATSSSQSTVSVIRLDKRRWAANNHYTVVIDPPPSRVFALQKVCDPYGVWLTVEHDEAFIIPLRGKILVLIKPDEFAVSGRSTDEQQECTLNVNSNAITIEEEQQKPPLPVPNRMKQTSFSQNFLKQEEQDMISKMLSSKAARSPPPPPVAHEKESPSSIAMTEEAKIDKALKELPISPKEHAQAALSFLKLTDEQFGWTVLSDNSKSGIRISKKPGVKSTPTASSAATTSAISTTTTAAAATLATASNSKAEGSITEKSDTSAAFQVFDPYMVYKGSKVIENFSIDEIRSVITDIGHIRALYDDTIESKTDLIRQDDASGCKIIRQSIKALFPFKNREIYAVSCLAQEELSSLSNIKRTLYVESSLPDFPQINPKKTRGHLFMSGWILEPIDPYNTTTTNHPIPSTRVIYVAALDLGVSVPSYISNLVANNWFPKKLQAVEAYLKSKGPPPVISQPFPLLVFANNVLSKAQQDNAEWTCLHASYDQKHHFKVIHRLRILPEQKKARLEDVQPTAPSSASLEPPFRRPSNHTLTPETRRGSLPTNTLPKKRTTASKAVASAAGGTQPTLSSSSSYTTTSATTTTTTTTLANPVTYRAVTCLQATFDLRPYTKGYEITAQFYQHTAQDNRKNISNKLELCISEPPLSDLLDGSNKKKKHTVAITAQGLSAASVYELEFSLIPARQETLSNKAAQLTVSHVLGEDQVDDGSWRGVILVNGVEASINSDIKLKPVHQDSLDSSSLNNSNNSGSSKGVCPIKEAGCSTDSPEAALDTDGSAEQQLEPRLERTIFPEEETQYMGGSVVANALVNVSAGVNVTARMMSPFRAASNSFLLSNSSEHHIAPDTSSASSTSASEDEHHNQGFTRQEQTNTNASTMTMHEIRLLRKSSDTMRKGMLLLFICLGLAVVFALLMLQPMLERYYASFSVSSTVASLNRSIEKGNVRRLMQIPWFGDWDIQLIAVRRA